MSLVSSHSAVSPSPERTQALVRILVVAVVLVAGVALSFWRTGGLARELIPPIVAMGLYGLFALGWWAMVSSRPAPSTARLAIALVSDVTIASVAMHLAQDLSAFFYPVYLWIVIGHGMRYGTRFLIAGMLLAAAGFAAVILTTSYWQRNPIGAAGLWLGLLLVPMYFLSLLRRLQEANRRLRELLSASLHAASHDALTGLANRGHFLQRLEQEIDRAQRHDGGFAVVFIDLDHFKQVNDSIGHHAGDVLLQRLGDRLRRICRRTDVAARFGGDEFAMLIDGVRQQHDLEEPLRRISKAVARPVAWEGGTLEVSASIGISLYPAHGHSADELTRRADLAMYEVKRSGKRGASRIADVAPLPAP